MEFKKANLDFDNMKVRGEYGTGWYRLAEDTPKKGLFNSSAYEKNVIGKVDDGGEWNEQAYVCVK